MEQGEQQETQPLDPMRQPAILRAVFFFRSLLFPFILKCFVYSIKKKTAMHNKKKLQDEKPLKH